MISSPHRVVAAAWLLLTSFAAIAAPPDLTGIWTMGTDGRAGAALNGVGDFEKTAPFTPLARRKLAEHPSRGGISYGRWDGKTLVVETTGLVESIDQPTAHSDIARIVERYTPYTEGGLKRLRVEVTIHDPEFYTSPPTLHRTYTQLREGRMLDYDCTEPDWEDHLESLRQQRKP